MFDFGFKGKNYQVRGIEKLAHFKANPNATCHICGGKNGSTIEDDLAIYGIVRIDEIINTDEMSVVDLESHEGKMLIRRMKKLFANHPIHEECSSKNWLSWQEKLVSDTDD